MAGSYTIETDAVTLSRNDLWEKLGIAANDYSYTTPDGKVKVDFQDLMVKVGARKAAVLEGEITPMATRMRTRNNYLKDLSQILAALTTAQANLDGEAKGSDKVDVTLSSELLAILNAIDGANGKVSGGKATKADLEGLVQLVKGVMDKQNNDAQTDMTRLQSLVDSRDDSYSTATSMMSAISDTRSNLIGNL